MAAIVDAFRLADATAPERAQTLDLLGVTRSRELNELSESGVLVPGPGSGSWYLSERAYITHRDAPRARSLRGLAIAILVMLVLLVGLMVNLMTEAR
jgi:DNA-binding IclR family transcriptional regulator